MIDVAATGDAFLIACACLTGAASRLDASRVRLRAEIDACLARDSASCPPPSRAVLVLHDTPATLLSLAHLIASSLGVPVLEASTIAEARVQMRERPAVIVSDYHLGDGVTCATLLRDRPAWMRALIVTGRTDATSLDSIAQGVGAGVKVLSTPVTDEEQEALTSAVSEALSAA